MPLFQAQGLRARIDLAPKPLRLVNPVLSGVVMGSAHGLDISEANYLAGEELPGPRHEYVAGQVFAMAGATKTHGTIAGNIFFRLRAELRGTPCRAWVADMKVNVAAADTYYYPDVVATCAEEDLRSDSPQSFVTAPKLIVEVLSPSTEKIDRRENC